MAMIIVAVALQSAMAGTAVEIDKEVDAALQKLYAHSPVAKDFFPLAKGTLVFPDVYKSMASFGNMQLRNFFFKHRSDDAFSLRLERAMVSSDWI